MHSGRTSLSAAGWQCIHALRECRKARKNCWNCQRRCGELQTIVDFTSVISAAHLQFAAGFPLQITCPFGVGILQRTAVCSSLQDSHSKSSVHLEWESCSELQFCRALQNSHSRSSVHLEWEYCSELAPSWRNLGFGSANFSKCMWISLCGITNLVLWRKRARVGWAGQGWAGPGWAGIGWAGQGAI